MALYDGAEQRSRPSVQRLGETRFNGVHRQSCVLSGLGVVLALMLSLGAATQQARGFVYVINDGAPLEAHEVRIPPHLEDAVAEAERMLIEAEKGGDGALVFIVRAPGEAPVEARTRMTYISNGRGGYIPGRATTGVPKVQQVRRGGAVELRVWAPGYDAFVRKVVVRPGWIVVWDNVELKPLSFGTSATVFGRLWLEGETKLGDVPIKVDGETIALTDPDGYFVLERIQSGELRVSAYKRGFVGSYASLKVKVADDAVCELRGYRERAVRVRWVYQPDGSRSFVEPLPSGVAVLSPRGVNRVSFARGLTENVDGKSDFLLMQEATELRIRNFDQTGPGGPAFVRVNEPFGRISTAPPIPKRSKKMRLREGDVFVFRCYDGKHFAKMEVLEITDDSKQIKAWKARSE